MFIKMKSKSVKNKETERRTENEKKWGVYAFNVRNILLNMIVLYFTNFQKSILHLKFILLKVRNIRVWSQIKSYREQLAVNKSVHHVQEQR